MSCTLQRKHITIKRKTASDVSRQYSSSDPVKRSAAAAAVADNQMTIYWLMSSVWWSNLSSNMLFMNLWLLPRLTQPSNEVKEVRRQQKWSLQRHSVMLSLCTSSPRLLLNSSSSSILCLTFLFSFQLFCCIFFTCPSVHLTMHVLFCPTQTASAAASSLVSTATSACWVPAASQSLLQSEAAAVSVHCVQDRYLLL